MTHATTPTVKPSLEPTSTTSISVAGTPAAGPLGYTNAITGLLLALCAPVLGAIADKNGPRKPWVAGTVVAMVIGAMALWFDASGQALHPCSS